MLGLVIGSDSTGRQLFLRDVADHPAAATKIRLAVCCGFDGQPAIGLGISTVQGGNVVTMGNGVRRKLDALKRDQPIGIEIGDINFQPTAVVKATNSFIFNLGKAVTIVFVVLLFVALTTAVGWKLMSPISIPIGWSLFSAHPACAARRCPS